jgi:hypothetical protein
MYVCMSSSVYEIIQQKDLITIDSNYFVETNIIVYVLLVTFSNSWCLNCRITTDLIRMHSLKCSFNFTSLKFLLINTIK